MQKSYVNGRRLRWHPMALLIPRHSSEPRRYAPPYFVGRRTPVLLRTISQPRYSIHRMKPVIRFRSTLLRSDARDLLRKCKATSSYFVFVMAHRPSSNLSLVKGWVGTNGSFIADAFRKRGHPNTLLTIFAEHRYRQPNGSKPAVPVPKEKSVHIRVGRERYYGNAGEGVALGDVLCHAEGSHPAYTHLRIRRSLANGVEQFMETLRIDRTYVHTTLIRLRHNCIE